MNWVRRTDPETGRKSLLRVFADGEVYGSSPCRPAPPLSRLAFQHATSGVAQDDILARIDRALAEADAQQPEWHAEREDSEGYVTWAGSADAADSTRRDLRAPRRSRREGIDHGTPDGRLIGFAQANLLRYVMHHPGCSVDNATKLGLRGYYTGNPFGKCYTDRAWALHSRGLLDIDTTRSNRYALTVTESGIAALRAHAAPHDG